MEQDRRQPDLNDNLIILMSFCYHSEVIHMGYDCGEGIVDGTRHSESFSSSFHHHSDVIRMGLDYGEDIVDGTRQKAT